MHIYIFIFIYIYVYICMYVYSYVPIYIYTHIYVCLLIHNNNIRAFWQRSSSRRPAPFVSSSWYIYMHVYTRPYYYFVSFFFYFFVSMCVAMYVAVCVAVTPSDVLLEISNFTYQMHVFHFQSLFRMPVFKSMVSRIDKIIGLFCRILSLL